jgi:hypothetical protein
MRRGGERLGVAIPANHAVRLVHGALPRGRRVTAGERVPSGHVDRSAAHRAHVRGDVEGPFLIASGLGNPLNGDRLRVDWIHVRNVREHPARVTAHLVAKAMIAANACQIFDKERQRIHGGTAPGKHSPPIDGEWPPAPGLGVGPGPASPPAPWSGGGGEDSGTGPVSIPPCPFVSAGVFRLPGLLDIARDDGPGRGTANLHPASAIRGVALGVAGVCARPLRCGRGSSDRPGEAGAGSGAHARRKPGGSSRLRQGHDGRSVEACSRISEREASRSSAQTWAECHAGGPPRCDAPKRGRIICFRFSGAGATARFGVRSSAGIATCSAFVVHRLEGSRPRAAWRGRGSLAPFAAGLIDAAHRRPVAGASAAILTKPEAIPTT